MQKRVHRGAFGIKSPGYSSFASFDGMALASIAGNDLILTDASMRIVQGLPMTADVESTANAGSATWRL